eukprot:gene51838-63385_t
MVVDAPSVLAAFQATYLCVGTLTLLAAAIFFQLPPDSGRAVRRAPPVTTNAFSALPLSAAMLANLDALGYHEMTPIQALGLPVILKGQDLIAQAMEARENEVMLGLGFEAPYEEADQNGRDHRHQADRDPETAVEFQQ